jgi:hypothetical protein
VVLLVFAIWGSSCPLCAPTVPPPRQAVASPTWIVFPWVSPLLARIEEALTCPFASKPGRKPDSESCRVEGGVTRLPPQGRRPHSCHSRGPHLVL